MFDDSISMNVHMQSIIETPMFILQPIDMTRQWLIPHHSFVRLSKDHFAAHVNNVICVLFLTRPAGIIKNKTTCFHYYALIPFSLGCNIQRTKNLQGFNKDSMTR